MVARCRQPAAFTLIELLIVIAVLGILVGLAMPSSGVSTYDQLRAVARITATDLAYGRSLALANNSQYRFTFDLPNNRYVLKHSGSNPALQKLPKSPFADPSGPSDQYVVDLDELPHVGPTVRLVAVAALGTSLEKVGDLEFGPLGQTTRSSTTLLWLAAGSGANVRYISLVVNPVTGMAEVGPYSSQGPPASVLPAPPPSS